MSDDFQNTTATVETSVGTMKFEFFPDKAIGHVKNFVQLAEDGFYDDTIFHRVISGFMIQGGCPRGDGTGGPGHTIKAEFNDTHHERGILSMARSQNPNSAGSQFFIMHATAPHLDGQYTVFGETIDGIEVVDKIVNTPRNSRDRPDEDQKILDVLVEEWETEKVEATKAEMLKPVAAEGK